MTSNAVQHMKSGRKDADNPFLSIEAEDEFVDDHEMDADHMSDSADEGMDEEDKEFIDDSEFQTTPYVSSLALHVYHPLII